MTDTEYRTHFSMWAMMAAPRMTGSGRRVWAKRLRDGSRAVALLSLTNDTVDVAPPWRARAIPPGHPRSGHRPLSELRWIASAIRLLPRQLTVEVRLVLCHRPLQGSRIDEGIRTAGWESRPFRLHLKQL